MVNIFGNSIGRRIVEKTYGLISWEGEITQMDLTVGGVTYRRTMDCERWHNKVKTEYTDNATSVATATAWSDTAASSDIFGESCYIDVVMDNYDATSAAALRDRRLTENAFPKPVPVSGLSVGGSKPPDSLHIYCSGYVMSMNRRFRESDTAAAALDTQITTLVGESEFVAAGTLDSNAMTAPISGSEIPFRLWDGVEDLVLMGDGSGNRWIGGVYGERKFDYKQAATSVTHYWRDGKLVNALGGDIIPSMLKPNMIVQVSTNVNNVSISGSNVWDDPKNIYIEEVEFTMPNKYRLIASDDAWEVTGGL